MFFGKKSVFWHFAHLSCPFLLIFQTVCKGGLYRLYERLGSALFQFTIRIDHFGAKRKEKRPLAALLQKFSQVFLSLKQKFPHFFQDFSLPPGDLHLGGAQHTGGLALGLAREKAQVDERTVLGRQTGEHLFQPDAVRQVLFRGIHRDVQFPSGRCAV